MNHAQNLHNSYICEYVFELLFPKKATTENFLKQLEYFQKKLLMLLFHMLRSMTMPNHAITIKQYIM